jgi:hypothetical protein
VFTVKGLTVKFPVFGNEKKFPVFCLEGLKVLLTLPYLLATKTEPDY